MRSGLIDSHAHLTSDEVYPEIDSVLARAQEAGVSALINICTDAVTLERGLLLRKRVPWVYNVASTTPHDVATEGEKLFDLMAGHARSGDLVAVGETGLDSHYTHSPKELQQEFLRRYLRLALECRLPVVIHCREAFSDLFRILDEEYAGAPGVLHCFTGTLEEAKRVLERGWAISLSGIVTFKKSTALREIIPHIPLQQLLIETDTPYLAPQSKRGQQNEPAFLPEIAALVAFVKGVSVEEVVQATSQNARNLFKLPAQDIR
jgi:TatD DNase family protein